MALPPHSHQKRARREDQLSLEAANQSGRPLAKIDVPYFKQLIHDMNNSLMVIGISADQLEQLAQANQVPADGPSLITHDKASQVLRHNITLIKDMLNDAAAALPGTAATSQIIVRWSYEGVAAFIAHQQIEWALIIPPTAHITVQIAPFEGQVMLNPPYLARVLQNLVRNACEAYHRTPIRDAPLIITLTARRREGALSLYFADNGPGIDDAIVAHIFRPDFSTKERAVLPTGLGLASAKSLAQQMGGDLALAPSKGARSTFVLTLSLEE